MSAAQKYFELEAKKTWFAVAAFTTTKLIKQLNNNIQQTFGCCDEATNCAFK